MACSRANMTDTNYRARTVQSSLLATLLVLDLLGNIYLLVKFRLPPRKWAPHRRIVKSLATVGLLNGLVNIAVHMVKLILDDWFLGNTVCQFHGVVGSVLLHGWTWLVTMAVFERFVRLLMPGEHTSFFSEVNLRIMIWGMFLLLTVMFLGPVYGWGEYSPFRGKIDMHLSVTNSSKVTRPTAPVPSANDPQKPENSHEYNMMVYYEFLAGNEDIPTSMDTLKNLTDFFSRELNMSIRKPRRTAEGVEIPLRAADEQTLACLWRDYRMGVLDQDLLRIVAHDEILGLLGLNIFGSVASINATAFKQYERIYMPYQALSMCALDFSPVNQNVLSFVLFTYMANLFLPLFIQLYFCVRLVHAGFSRLCMFSTDGAAPEDAKWTKVFLYTGFSTVMCHIPYLVTNLALGRGVYVPIQIQCLALVMLYSCTFMLFVFYWSSLRAGDLYEEVQCCSGLGTKDEHTGLLSDIQHRLLAKSSPSSTPSVQIIAQTDTHGRVLRNSETEL